MPRHARERVVHEVRAEDHLRDPGRVLLVDDGCPASGDERLGGGAERVDVLLRQKRGDDGEAELVELVHPRCPTCRCSAASRARTRGSTSSRKIAISSMSGQPMKRNCVMPAARRSKSASVTSSDEPTMAIAGAPRYGTAPLQR